MSEHISIPLEPVAPVNIQTQRTMGVKQWLDCFETLSSAPPPRAVAFDIQQSFPTYLRSHIVSDIQRGISGKRMHWWAEKDCLVAYYLLPSLAQCGYKNLSLREFIALGDYFDKFALGVTCVYSPSANGACVPMNLPPITHTPVSSKWERRRPHLKLAALPQSLVTELPNNHISPSPSYPPIASSQEEQHVPLILDGKMSKPRNSDGLSLDLSDLKGQTFMESTFISGSPSSITSSFSFSPSSAAFSDSSAMPHGSDSAKASSPSPAATLSFSEMTAKRQGSALLKSLSRIAISRQLTSESSSTSTSLITSSAPSIFSVVSADERVDVEYLASVQDVQTFEAQAEGATKAKVDGIKSMELANQSSNRSEDAQSMSGPSSSSSAPKRNAARPIKPLVSQPIASSSRSTTKNPRAPRTDPPRGGAGTDKHHDMSALGIVTPPRRPPPPPLRRSVASPGFSYMNDDASYATLLSFVTGSDPDSHSSLHSSSSISLESQSEAPSPSQHSRSKVLVRPPGPTTHRSPFSSLFAPCSSMHPYASYSQEQLDENARIAQEIIDEEDRTFFDNDWGLADFRARGRKASEDEKRRALVGEVKARARAKAEAEAEKEKGKLVAVAIGSGNGNGKGKEKEGEGVNANALASVNATGVVRNTRQFTPQLQAYHAACAEMVREAEWEFERERRKLEKAEKRKRMLRAPIVLLKKVGKLLCF